MIMFSTYIKKALQMQHSMLRSYRGGQLRAAGGGGGRHQPVQPGTEPLQFLFVPLLVSLLHLLKEHNMIGKKHFWRYIHRCL